MLKAALTLRNNDSAATMEMDKDSIAFMVMVVDDFSSECSGEIGRWTERAKWWTRRCVVEAPAKNESEIHGGKGIEEFPANCQRYLGTCGGRDLAGKDPPPASHRPPATATATACMNRHQPHHHHRNKLHDDVSMTHNIRIGQRRRPIR